MEKEKKNKLKNILIWTGLGVLVVFVVITAIVLHSKNQQYQEIKDKNDAVKPTQEYIKVID